MKLKWVTVGYIIFLSSVLVLSSLEVLPTPRDLVARYTPGTFLDKNFPRRIPHDDKIAHFFLIGGLALLVNLSLSLSRVSIGKLNILKGSLIIFVVMTLEEFSQVFFPSRSFSLLDLFSGYAGVFCFGHVATYLVNHRASLETKFPAVIAALIWRPQMKHREKD